MKGAQDQTRKARRGRLRDTPPLINLLWLVSSRRRNERVAARDNALEREPQLERLVREHGLEAPKKTMDLC